jgi:hypothetical protein
MALKEIEYRLEKRMGTETVSSCDKAPVSPGRLRRKSAKAAAALVSAVAKEELTLTLTVKRNYVRSQSAPVKSSSRVASSSSSSGGGANRSGKKTALSQHAVQYLKNWMLSPDHIEHPYPTEEEKAKIMKETAIDIKQLTNWFVNNRKRYWKPKVEEYQRRSSESKRTLKQIAEEEWMDLDGDADNNYIVSDEGEDNEKQQPKKKRQRASVTSKIGGDEGCATISPANSPKPKRSYKGVKGKEGTAPELPVLTSGIFTAKSHASIKAANAMRYVGETETSSSEIDESDELEEDAATIFSSSTEESKVITAEIVEPEELAYMHLEEMGNVGCGCVADPLSSMIVSFLCFSRKNVFLLRYVY